jgi:hypothetical protein
MQGVVVHTCNPSTWEVEAGGSWVQGQLGYIARPCLENKTKTNMQHGGCQYGHRPSELRVTTVNGKLCSPPPKSSPVHVHSPSWFPRASQTLSASCLYTLPSGDTSYKGNHITWLFVTGFFHLTWCFSNSWSSCLCLQSAGITGMYQHT